MRLTEQPERAYSAPREPSVKEESAAHVPEVMKLLKEKGMEDVMVLVGGLIPDEDVDWLKKEGIKEIFGAGLDLNHLIELISTGVRT